MQNISFNRKRGFVQNSILDKNYENKMLLSFFLSEAEAVIERVLAGRNQN